MSKFELDGVRVDIEEKISSGTQQTNPATEYWVAGFLVGGKEAEDSTNQNENENENNTGETPIPYEFIAEKISVTNSSIDAYMATGQQKLNLSSIQVANIRVDKNKSTGKVKIDLDLNDAPGTLVINADFSHGNGIISVDGSLRDYNLNTLNSFLPEADFKVTGTSNIEFESTVDIDGDRIGIQSKKILLGGQNILFSNDVIQLSSHAQNISITHLNVNIAKDQKPAAELNFNVKFDRTRLVSAVTQDTFGEWTALQIDGATFNFQEDFQTYLDTVKISGVILSQKTPKTNAEKIPALVGLDDITISKVTANNENLDINSIVVSGLTTDLLIGTDKNIRTLVDVSPMSKNKYAKNAPVENGADGPASKNTTTNNPSASSYGIRLGHVELVNTQRLYFQDSSVDPKYERTFFINKLTAGPFDSRKPLDKSPFLIDGLSDKYAKFDFQGNVSPFTEFLNFSLKGKFSEISLPSVSSYMKDALGFELKSGQLDTELDLSVRESVISGKTRLKIRGIEMSAADDNQADSLQDNKALPLNAALSMLKDRKNNIDLKIPLSGNVDNPSFGMSSFIALVVEKAALKQAKSYLLQTFVPYASVVTVVMAAGEHALKIRFNDLVYPVSDTEINQQQEAFMQQFIKLMEDKPGTQVKLCAISSISDIGAKGSASSIGEAEKEQLRNIAQQRADNFKTYVLSKSDIKSSRLFLCAPEIDFDEKSQPRIKFST